MWRLMRQRVRVAAASYLVASDHDHYRRSEKRIGDYCEAYFRGWGCSQTKVVMLDYPCADEQVL